MILAMVVDLWKELMKVNHDNLVDAIHGELEMVKIIILVNNLTTNL